MKQGNSYFTLNSDMKNGQYIFNWLHEIASDGILLVRLIPNAANKFYWFIHTCFLTLQDLHDPHHSPKVTYSFGSLDFVVLHTCALSLHLFELFLFVCFKIDLPKTECLTTQALHTLTYGFLPSEFLFGKIYKDLLSC